MANKKKYDYVFKVIIIGEERSGKTALVTRYAKGTFPDAYVPTVGVDFNTKKGTQDGKSIPAQIYDTTGQPKHRHITTSFFEGRHGAIIVFDVTHRESFEQVNNWLKDLEEYGPESIPKLLVGNKCDLIAKRCVTYEESKSLAVKYDMDYLETSAKTNNNVDNAFETLYAEMRKKMDKQKKMDQQNIPSENVIRFDIAGVAQEQLAVLAVEEKPTAPLSADKKPWAEKIIKELDKLNTRMESLDTVKNTVASMSKRLEELEHKMSILEKKS